MAFGTAGHGIKGRQIDTGLIRPIRRTTWPYIQINLWQVYTRSKENDVWKTDMWGEGTIDHTRKDTSSFFLLYPAGNGG